MNELYIGVMSGTSLDGVDVTLCEINSSECNLISSLEYPLNIELKNEILALIDGTITLEEVGMLDNKLGNLFADAVNALIQKERLDSTKITAIGLHGQTLWHQPAGKNPFSMQLGDANIVMTKTNIKVVADFRRMDIANGGQGAPFAPAFHHFLFADIKKKTAVLNIGGMANITLLGQPMQGWDTGVGNALMDYWMQTTQNKAYDEDGLFASSGKVDKNLLESMLNDEYFKKPPPKSTGREYFNATWLANHLPMFHTIKDEDIQRTLLELTLQSIANDLSKYHLDLLIICGGGAKNIFLMRLLRDLCRINVRISDEIGVSSDFMESMAFAWLAYKRIHNEKVDLKSVTGATKNSILGGIYG